MYFFHEQNEREPVNASSQKEESVVRVLPSRGINKKHQNTAALLLPSHDSFSIKKMSEPIVSISTMSSSDTSRTDDAVIPHQEDYSLRRHSLTLVKPTTSRKRGISFLSGEKATQGNNQLEVNFLGKSLKRVSTTNSCFVLEAKYGVRQFHKAERKDVLPSLLHQSESLVLEIPVICKKSSNASCISIISSNQRRRKSEIFSKANTSFNSSNGSLNSKQKVPLEFSEGVFSSSSQRGSDTNVAYYDKGVEATENRAWFQNESLRFNKSVDDQISTIEDAKLLVKKTREVSMLSNRFMLASTENECYEIVSRLLYSLFGVDRCTYTLMMDEENFLLQECATAQFGPNATDIIFSDGEEEALVCPLQDCATEHCAESLDAYYSQDLVSSESYPEYKTFRRVGYKTFLSVPILIGARKFAGALHIASEQANGFNEIDIMLIKDIGYRIGGHLYSKRLQEEQAESHEASRKLLQSMIPGPVLEKIEEHWKNSSDDELSSCQSSSLNCSSDNAQDNDYSRLTSLPRRERRGSLNIDPCDYESTQRRLENMGILKRETMLLGKKHMTPTSSITSESDISESKPVLFAETQSNVSIIFCDIVGFSRIARTLEPIEVMQMLNDLYHIFDTLCKKHGVRKLETIGDTYIVSGGLLEEGNDNDLGKDAAKRCLAMAQDMVREAYNVYAPTEPRERLQIRVGIHVGNLSYGILGQNVPKFSVYGDAVNIAARMEQTAPVGKVHVSKAFHDLENDHHMVWDEKRNTDVKNVGVMETWIMNCM